MLKIGHEIKDFLLIEAQMTEGRKREIKLNQVFCSDSFTLFAEFREETEACNGRSCEDDDVLAGNVMTQLLSHEAVELRFVLQRRQTVGTLVLLQMHVDLRSARTGADHRTHETLYTT